MRSKSLQKLALLPLNKKCLQSTRFDLYNRGSEIILRAPLYR